MAARREEPGRLAGPRGGGRPELRAALAACWNGPVRWGCPMARLSTLRVGGPAAAVVEPGSIQELQTLVAGLHQRQIPWWVIGRGSNILAPDEGLSGVVILLGRAFGRISPLAGFSGEGRGATERSAGQLLVSVEAGCSLQKFLSWCVQRAFSGMEAAVGIPGSVGGSIIMNAGANGWEMRQSLIAVTALDREGGIRRLTAEECGFAYRKSELGTRGMLVVEGLFRLTRGSRREIEAWCRAVGERRKQVQPLHLPSAGSFFKNPPEAAAGELIDRTGLKGLAVGGAQVSTQHANFIVNTGSATARDIVELMREVQQRVLARTGITLEPEVRLLGRWN